MGCIYPDVCDIGGKGLLLPAFRDNEQQWPNALRIVLYGVGLGWCFLGVAIVADIFMSAIEHVTSKKSRKYDKKTKRYHTVLVWNPTIANLSLMALGSSAPEILLSVIELFSGGMKSGKLGPSTIVGSASFNLLCISAVCIIAIPEGETRRIKEMPVYMVTASCSIFAYIWLLFILQGPSPDVVDVWEGVLTFLFFPLLLGTAYLADIGFFSGVTGAEGDEEEEPKNVIMGPDMTGEELAGLTQKIRKQHGEHLSDDQVVRLLTAEYGPKTTRAQYRVGAMRDLTGGKKVERVTIRGNDESNTDTVTTIWDCAKELAALTEMNEAQVGFPTLRYAVFESVGVMKLPICRWGDTSFPVSVKYQTRDGTAMGGMDYEAANGTLHFAAYETEKAVDLKIIDDCNFEDDEEFFVDISEVRCPSGGLAKLTDKSVATVVIIDDDMPGSLRFQHEEMRVAEQLEDMDVEIQVERINGCAGAVGCSYRTEDGNATAGADYEKASGILEFANGQMSAMISVKVKARGRYESEETFRVVLSDPFGGATFDARTDGGRNLCVCTVVVHADTAARDQLKKVISTMNVNWDRAQLGHSNWKSQFNDALYVNGGEDGEVSLPEAIMHMISLPWKVIFACVPPVDYADGWLCFFAALAMIGGVTAVIGDLAGLLGCCLGLKPSITAITFVALGTSLPDTFASKVAAIEDPTADASIGNIVGSNSVNVFLGLGLPWMIGAIYWQINGPDEQWTADYPDVAAALGPGNARFVVEAGSLGFSVTVFVVCGLTCMALLWIRRTTCGGELGGSPGTKKASAAFLVGLWFIYVGLSSWNALQEVCD